MNKAEMVQQNNSMIPSSTASLGKDAEVTIDLFELFHALTAKWYMLLMCALIGAVLLNAYAFFWINPTYTSVAKLYVVASSGDSAIDLTDLNIGTSLTKDYQELIMSYPVLDQVIEELNLEMDTDRLARMVSLNNPMNTRVLELRVTSNDPIMSSRIANTLAGVAQEYLPETMGTVKPNVAQVARVPKGKSAPNLTRYTMMGALVGFVIMAAYLVLVYALDDTIRNSEEFERIFGFAPISSIPENSAMHLGDNRSKKGKHKSGRRHRSK